jgi:hypothetical protein
VEGVEALPSLRGPGVGGLLERRTQVHAYRFQGGAAGFAELVVERLQGRGALALGGPHHPAGLVVVGDHGQVPVALAVAHLVDPDAEQPGRPLGVDLFGDDPGDDDPPRRSPRRSAAAG